MSSVRQTEKSDTSLLKGESKKDTSVSEPKAVLTPKEPKEPKEKKEKKETKEEKSDREDTTLLKYLESGIIGLADGTKLELKKIPKKNIYTDLRTVYPSVAPLQTSGDLLVKKKRGRPKKKKRGRPKKNI